MLFKKEILNIKIFLSKKYKHLKLIWYVDDDHDQNNNNNKGPKLVNNCSKS